MTTPDTKPVTVKILPTAIWIEYDIFGARHVVVQHEGMEAFTFATFNYQYGYTDNASTYSAAMNLARSLGATEPIEQRSRQWAADVDAAQASSVTEPVGGGVVAALRELANVVSIHLGLGTIPGSYGPGLKGMAMSEWIRKALHASLEKSVVALSTHEATQREGGGTVSGAAEAVPAHWRAVLDPEQVPHQPKTPLHVVGFREERAARSWIAEQADFNGWRYTLEPLFTAPPKVGISASEAASDTEFCWLVELFLPEGNSLGSYHTGFTDLSGNSRSTPDPFKAKRYSKADAEAVAANLGHTLSGTWKAIEHGFATPPPAPQPPNANCPIKCNSMEQCSGACDFMEAAPQPAVVEALTPEQISAVYLLLVHRKRPEFGWMEVALLGAEKVLEPLHSAIHDAQFDAMDAAFRGGV